jgi:catechol 2,3-dioxygenase-like lactoylglutathione lyase family enzyme
MQISSAIPLLRIFSEAKAREFYVDFLGFSIDWEHRFQADFPLYPQARKAITKAGTADKPGRACNRASVTSQFRPFDTVPQIRDNRGRYISISLCVP